MTSRFPVLALGDCNWKAKQLAIDIYPSWWANYGSVNEDAVVTKTKNNGNGNGVLQSMQPIVEKV